MKLLIVHPEPAVVYTGSLEKEGFIIEVTTTLASAAEHTAVYYYDVVVVCTYTPDEELFSFISSIGERSPRTGIMVLSYEVDTEYKVRAILEGADEYLIWPVEYSEVRARIYTLIRRCTMGGVKQVTHNGISIDPAARKVECLGKPVVLTRKEYELLFFFLRNTDRILTHEMIAEYLWGDIKSLTADCFDFIYSHVKNIRKKLSRAGSGRVIDTVYGVGYVVR